MHDVLHGFMKHVGCLTGFYQIYLTPTNLPPTTYSPTHRPQPTDHNPPTSRPNTHQSNQQYSIKNT